VPVSDDRIPTSIPAQSLGYIGRERPIQELVITARDVRKYCASTGHHNPVYLDLQAARALGHRSMPAPPLLPSIAARPIPLGDELLEDGQFSDRMAPGLTGHTLAGGVRLEFLEPAYVGDTIIESTSVADIRETSGRSGPLILQIDETTARTTIGRTISATRSTLIIRPDTSAPAAPRNSTPWVPPSAGTATPTRGRPGEDLPHVLRCPDIVDLFMFGALIWGTHRIHYDAAFAASEGLPGPLVHGWLQAAYLANYVEAWAGPEWRITEFAVDFLGMCTAGETLHCGGSVIHRDDTGVGLGLNIWKEGGLRVARGVSTLEQTTRDRP
jgi:acyl dehydratase